MMIPNETSPLLIIVSQGTDDGGKAATTTQAEACQSTRRKQRRLPTCCCTTVATIIIAVAPVLAFLVFRIVVHFQMAHAWDQAQVLPNPSMQLSLDVPGAIVTRDKWQGTRLAFCRPPLTNQSESTKEAEQEPLVPLIIIHGVEVTAADMDREAALLSQMLPAGTYIQSVEYAPGAVTYFQPLQAQYAHLCRVLRNHPIFGKAPVVDVMGHSSGAILARAIAQNPTSCWQQGRSSSTSKPLVVPQIRHYIGLAGPQQGVVAPIPGRAGQRLAAMPRIDSILTTVAKSTWFQQWIVATASYLYSPYETEDDDMDGNIFGPSSLVGSLNQGRWLQPTTTEGLQWNSIDTNTLSHITGNVLLISSRYDEVIQPTESAWFARLVQAQSGQDIQNLFSAAADTSKNNTASSTTTTSEATRARILRPLCDTNLWYRDNIGLKQLWDEGRLYLYESPTRHGPLLETDYTRMIAPVLRMMPPSIDSITSADTMRQDKNLQATVGRYLECASSSIPIWV